MKKVSVNTKFTKKKPSPKGSKVKRNGTKNKIPNGKKSRESRENRIDVRKRTEEKDVVTAQGPLLNRIINPKSRSLNEVLHTKAILEVLQEEDREYSVEEISTKSKLSTASVYIWICSVGKKMKEIKRVGIGLYKYQGTI